MDCRHLAHVAADPDFYDDTWHAAPHPDDVLGVEPPEGVTSEDRGPWRVLHTRTPLPDTGWKVHVSCVPDRAAHVVGVAVRTALAEGLTCKHLRTRRLVASTQAKYAEPTGAGKVVTIYPPDDAALERVLTRLTERLAGEPGGRVLSDVPVDGAPVSVRFGAFRGVHRVRPDGRCAVGRLGADGVATADDRSAHSAHRAATVPSVVERLRRAAADRDGAAVLPVRDVRVLHRSNAGGVYAATWTDGRRVVLKEARRHTGFDLAGADAVTRLRHERAALERLAGTGVVPEVVAHHEAGDSEFLVMELVEGPVATTTMATRHPGAMPGEDGPAYRGWVDDLLRRTRAALAVLHDHGVVHLDVHPGNVVERDGQVVLLDLESCALDGDAVARGVATVLSTCGDDVTPAADLAALDRMRALLLNPQYSLVARRPDLAAALLAAGEADLAADPEQADAASTPEGAAPDGDRLAAGLRVAADPARTDRLLPADVAAFGTPGGGLGMLHGATGVLGALAATGRPTPTTWLAWAARHATAAPYLPPGLGDGADGIALGLARAGETDAAADLLHRWGDRPSPCPWWARGTAGQAVAHAELATLLDDPSLVTSALALAAETLEALDRDVDPPGHRAGLLDGWAGVGLALLRVAEVVTAHEPDADALTTRLRTGARAAFDRELPSVRRRGDAWLTTDGGRLMPYLGTGSAALGLLGRALADVAPDGSVPDAVLEESVRGAVGAVRVRSVAGAGLLHGRAGLLAVLAALAPEDPVAALHRRRLGWYTVPVTSTARRDSPEAGVADLVLGEQNLRCSTDLATGTAGVLLATDGDQHDAATRVLRLLCLPVPTPTWQTSPMGMTAVTTSH